MAGSSLNASCAADALSSRGSTSSNTLSGERYITCYVDCVPVSGSFSSSTTVKGVGTLEKSIDSYRPAGNVNGMYYRGVTANYGSVIRWYFVYDLEEDQVIFRSKNESSLYQQLVFNTFAKSDVYRKLKHRLRVAPMVRAPALSSFLLCLSAFCVIALDVGVSLWIFRKCWKLVVLLFLK